MDKAAVPNNSEIEINIISVESGSRSVSIRPYCSVVHSFAVYGSSMSRLEAQSISLGETIPSRPVAWKFRAYMDKESEFWGEYLTLPSGKGNG